MTRIGLAAGAVLLAGAPAAMAADHKDGFYLAGEQTGFGVMATVKGRTISMVRLSVPETCTSDSSTLDQPVTFFASDGIELRARIRKDGSFRGAYDAGDGDAYRIAGRVRGRKATIKGRWDGHYSEDGVDWVCKGQDTYRARLSNAPAGPERNSFYVGGSLTGDPGIIATVKDGTLSIVRISFMETCTSAETSKEYVFWLTTAPSARMDAAIDDTGAFEGAVGEAPLGLRYSGRVEGTTATITATVSSAFTEDGVAYTCSGTYTFRAQRKGAL